MFCNRLYSSDEESDDEIARSRKKPKQRLRDNVPRLRDELDALLAQPLMARGVSAKYPTSGSRVVIDDLLSATSECFCRGVH
jgi:ATP-dependent RNA helicase DDX24/MAK5